MVRFVASAIRFLNPLFYSMKLSAKTRYASRILLDLALHATDSPQRVTDIALRTGISVSFIEQIIKPLKRAGLVLSKRGPAGGHRLAGARERISLGDVVRIMEGNVDLAMCIHDPTQCGRVETCLTRNAWKRASDAMLRELDAITLADLVQNGGYCSPASLRAHGGLKEGPLAEPEGCRMQEGVFSRRKR